MEMMEAILRRRSIRRFTEQPIERDVLEQLINAARWAPNGNNNNLWRFLAVMSPNQKRLVLRFSPGVFDMPAAIIVVCMKHRREKITEAIRLLHMADAAIACQNICLAAESMGIGSCIVYSYNAKALKPILGLADDVPPYLMVTLGYPDESPEPPPRLPLNEIAFIDEYGKAWE